MNRHIPLIATTLLGIALVSGCATSNNNSTSNNTTPKTTAVQSQTTNAKTTNTALVKKSTSTGTSSHALLSKPDKYTVPPDWVSNQLVYVVGWDKQTNPTKALFVSNNAGKTWAKLTTPLASDIFQVHFQTSTTGIIDGSTGTGQNSEPIMYRTTDGGSHWMKESYPTRITQGASKYGDPQITFVTLNHKLTWMLAAWNDNQFPRHALYHSADNGVTWTYANNNSSTSAEGYLSNFYAPDSQTAYFVSFCSKCAAGDTTGINTLDITHDAGRTWTKIILPFTGENQVKRLVFSDSERGTATVENVMTNKVRQYAE